MHALHVACRQQYDAEGRLIWRGLRVRIGMSYGFVNNKKPLNTGRADYFGVLPNGAARVSALAAPGQVGILNVLGLQGLESAGKRCWELAASIRVTTTYNYLRALGVTTTYNYRRASTCTSSWYRIVQACRGDTRCMHRGSRYSMHRLLLSDCSHKISFLCPRLLSSSHAESCILFVSRCWLRPRTLHCSGARAMYC
jgi:hypothetical protein